MKFVQHREVRDLVADIDLGSFRIAADGLLTFPSHRSLQLPRRLAQPLTVLAESPGCVVSKDHLIQTCWHDADVSEQSLAKAIADLRKCFRAEGINPIQTVYGIGYRLVVPVASGDEAPSARRATSFRREAAFRVHERRPNTLRVAERLLSTAIQTHPIPDDWLEVAQIHFHTMQLGYVPTEEAWSKARPALDHVLEDSRAEALSLLALGRCWALWEFDLAGEMLAEARGLDPTGYLTNECSGLRELAAGDFDSAVNYFSAAVKASPAALSPRGGMALALCIMNQREPALSLTQEMLDLDNENPVSWGFQALVETRVGDPDIGAEAARRCVERLPESPLAESILAYALAASGRQEPAGALLQSSAGETTAAGNHPFACWTWLELGDIQRALGALQKGFEKRCPWLTVLLNDPATAVLHREPEFQTIVRGVYAA
jgi:DNA-binding winged helix-turn-helix (wHTH) protein